MLVDVGATHLKLLENSVVSQLCGILSDFIPKGKAETYEYCKLLRQGAVLDSCGVCFIAGWILGYPCVAGVKSRKCTEGASDHKNASVPVFKLPLLYSSQISAANR